MSQWNSMAPADLPIHGVSVLLTDGRICTVGYRTPIYDKENRPVGFRWDEEVSGDPLVESGFDPRFWMELPELPG